jgi:hypothetical protein
MGRAAAVCYSKPLDSVQIPRYAAVPRRAGTGGMTKGRARYRPVTLMATGLGIRLRRPVKGAGGRARKII